MSILLLVSFKSRNFFTDTLEYNTRIIYLSILLPNIKEKASHYRIERSTSEGKVIFSVEYILENEVGTGVKALKDGVKETCVS